jgi:glycosyltransferase involved in cell wall biosynthesis
MSEDTSPDSLSDVSLAVVLSPGLFGSVTLELYDEVGMLDRELALYRELGERLDTVYLVTNGGPSEYQYRDRLGDSIELVVNESFPYGIPFSFSLPFTKPRVFEETDVVRTNQIKASWSGALAAGVHDSQLVVRTGYVYSLFARYKSQPKPMKWLKNVIERVGYGRADGVITSSVEGHDYLERQYDIDVPHRVIPNYVETDVFQPTDSAREDGTICTVARFAEQKNLSSLIEAIGPLSCSLTLIGSGKLEDELRATANRVGADVTFVGNVPNHDLPAIFNEHQVYVLPSLYEGMPKSILEAMACGTPVVGTDVPGIREVVTHERDGLLCDPSVTSLRSSIDRLLSNPDLREQLGTNARDEIVENYSLDTIVEAELSLLGEVVMD